MFEFIIKVKTLNYLVTLISSEFSFKYFSTFLLYITPNNPHLLQHILTNIEG